MEFNEIPTETFESLGIAAEKILFESLFHPIEIDKIDRLTEPERRNLLLRCFINPVQDLPSSFI